MADKRIFTIQINGVSESVEAITSLNKQLDDLEQRLKNISSQGVSLNVSAGGSSGGKTSDELKEVDKLQKQILATKEKIAQADKDEYQELLKQKNELKEAQNVAKSLAANSRLNDGGYSDTIRGMKQELSDLKTVMNGMNPNDDGFGDMVKRANELNNKLKEIEQSYGQFNRNVGNYANGVAEGLEKAGNSAKKIVINVGGVTREFDNAKQASRSLGGELKMMAINGEQGTKAYQDLHKALATLVSDINDATKSSVAMDNMLDTMTSIAAIGNVGEGFSNLFGIDDSALGETIAKMQSLQSILQGLEALNQQMLSGEGIGGWLAKGNDAIDSFVNKLFGLQDAIESTSNSGEAVKEMSDEIASGAEQVAAGEDALASSAEQAAAGEDAISIANEKNASTSKAASTAAKTQATTNVALGTSTKATIATTEAQAVANTTLGGSAKAAATSLEVQSVANTTMATTSTAAAVAATALGVALKAIGIGLIIAAVNLLIEGLEKLWDYFDLGNKKLEEQQEQLKGQREAYAQASASIMEAQAAVNNFNGTKEQEKKLVNQLNSKYGDTLGTYKSVNEWQNVLAKNTDAYIELMVKQAEIQALVNLYTQDYIELQKLKAEALEGGFLSADEDDVAEQQAKVDKVLETIKEKEKEYAEYQKKHGIGLYAPQASQTATASTQREIKKSGNHIRTTVKNVEDDIRKMQIELMEQGLEKTLAQIRYEREKRIQEAKKSGRRIAEQVSLINRLYEKKEFEAKQAFYKKQLDALKKFESDRQNVIQSNNQRKIENSTTAAENKKNEEWDANGFEKISFAKGFANSSTSDKVDIDYTKWYNAFVQILQPLEELDKEIGETRKSLMSLEDEINKSGKITDAQQNKINELQRKLGELDEDYKGYAGELSAILDVSSLSESLNMRLNARVDYYNAVIEKAKDYYNKLKDIQDEALSGQVETEREQENKRHFEVAGDYKNNNLGVILKQYKIFYNQFSKLSNDESEKMLSMMDTDAKKEKFFEGWKHALDRWLNELKEKLKEGKITEKEYLDATNNELIKSYQEGTITYVQLLEQLEKEDEAHQNAMNTIEKNETEKRKQIQIKAQQDIQSAYSTYYGNLSNELDSFISDIKRRVGTQPVMNKFQIVNINQSKKDLKELIKAINSTFDSINNLKAKATVSFNNGFLNPEQYAEVTEQLDTLETQVIEGYKEATQKLKDLPADFVASLNTYLQAVGDTISGILSAFQDLQDNNFEYQQNMLDKEADMLDKKLSKIDEIYQKHKDNVSSIEDELASARGDRREHLIDQLNNETFAQRQAWMEEKKIQKEKEVNERKQEALAKKKRKEQKKWQLAQAIISGALAITNGFATKPFVPLGIAMGALASTLTAVQIATIASQKTYAKGGILDSRSVATGPRHSQGGIKLQPYGINAEIEGGEFVTNRKSTSTNLPLLEFINSKKRRVNLNDLVTFYNEGQPVRKSMANIQSRFANGGELPVLNDNLDSTQDRIIANMQELSNRPIYVAVTDIENKMEDVRQVRALAGIH